MEKLQEGNSIHAKDNAHNDNIDDDDDDDDDEYVHGYIALLLQNGELICICVDVNRTQLVDGNETSKTATAASSSSSSSTSMLLNSQLSSAALSSACLLASRLPPIRLRRMPMSQRRRHLVSAAADGGAWRQLRCVDDRWLAAANGKSIAMMRWNGGALSSSCHFASADGGSDNALVDFDVAAVDDCERLWVVAMRGGRVCYALTDVDDAERLPERWLRVDESIVGDACSVRIGGRRRLVAVGRRCGSIVLLRAVAGGFAPLHAFGGTDAWPRATLGAVRALEWSPDQTALASGWARRGVAVWSVHGRRLMCSLARGGAIDALVGRSGVDDDDDTRPASICWAADARYLVAASRTAIARVAFAKTCGASAPRLNSVARRLMLSGTDCVMMLRVASLHGRRDDNAGDAAADDDDDAWQRLAVPHAYVRDNWPIRLMSMSRDGRLLAVAGRRGAAVYDMAQRRWRLFERKSVERSLRCVSLAWLGHVLVLLLRNAIVFVDGLSMSGVDCLLHREPINGGRLLDVAGNGGGGQLALLTDDAHFVLFAVARVRNEKIFSLTRTYETSLAAVTWQPRAMLLLLADSSSSAKCLMLNEMGFLAVVCPEQGVQIGVAEHVDQFWLSPVARDVGALWVSGADGVHVHVPFAVRNSVDAMHAMLGDGGHLVMPFDADVCPLGPLDASQGVLVGATSRMVRDADSGRVRFVLQRRCHPFAQVLVRHWLDADADAERAFQCLRRLRDAAPRCFAHSVELLLHDALDSSSSSSTSAQLDAVCALIGRFGEHLGGAAVRCARKIDPSHWRVLFATVGDPRVLFERSLEGGRFGEAASYLRVLQHLSGHVATRRAAYALLEHALRSRDLDSARDIVRFLSPVVEGEHADESVIEQLLLSRYARMLLDAHRLLDLLNLSVFSRQPLAQWLLRLKKQNHDGDGGGGEETGAELAARLADVCAEFRLDGPLQAAAGDEWTHARLCAIDVPRAPTYAGRWTAAADAASALRYLLGQTLQVADRSLPCASWALVLAAALGRVDLVRRLIAKHRGLSLHFGAMLGAQHNASAWLDFGSNL
jgi:RIC1